MKEAKRFLSAAFLILAAICVLAGVGFFIWEKTGHFLEIGKNKGDDAPIVVEKPIDVSIQSIPSVSSKEQEPEPKQEPEPEPEPEPERIPNPYAEWFLANSDMIAWLKIPDTIVDYPVMWTPGDEEFYLHLNFDKVKQRGGCLILDTDTCMDPLTTNLIIHGHNNENQMFGDLSKYEKQSYRDEHPYIYLYGKDYEHVYEVMCVFRSQVFYTTDTCFKYYNFFDAKTEDEFNYFYYNIKSLQYYDSGVTAEFGDHFLTLSTCSYHTDMGRFVVVAKEIEPGDFYEPLDTVVDD